MKRLLLHSSFVLLCIFIVMTAAAQTTVTYRVNGRNGAIKGTEQDTIAKSDTQYKLTTTSDLDTPNGPLHLFTQVYYSPDLSFQRYVGKASVGQDSQTLEAQRLEDNIVMTVRAGSQAPSRTVAAQAHPFLLDNAIVGHMQPLVDWLAKTPLAIGAAVTIQMLVPQRLATVSAEIRRVDTRDSGTLDGARVQLAEYTLQAGLLTEELWVDTQQNRLLRLFVPSQDFELIRDDFTFLPAPTAVNCVERDGSFPSAGLVIPGTICLPHDASATHKVPLVVLVAGSGPQNRDEEIGPNKPFFDIAEGLAANGIATLRFDKRTMAFPQWFTPQNTTVENEFVLDSVNALKFAATLPEVEPSQVFLLGHSLGGSLAPAIAERAGNVRGVIVLAGSIRPMDELIYRQTSEAMQRAGKTQAEIDSTVAQLKAAFASIRGGTAKDTDTLMGAVSGYWRDLLARDLAGDYRKLSVPVLVLQGGKDIQINRDDFDQILQALNGKPKGTVESHYFPDLNHFFIPVVGTPTGAEYLQPGHVSQDVIKAISDWVHATDAAAPAPAASPK